MYIFVEDEYLALHHYVSCKMIGELILKKKELNQPTISDGFSTRLCCLKHYDYDKKAQKEWDL